MGENSDALQRQAADLREKIARWRRPRGRRFPLPQELWAEAAALAHRMGTSRAAQALGVSCDALRRRMVGPPVPRRGAEHVDTVEFVEVNAAQLLGVPTAGGPVVEVVNADGMRLTIRLSSAEHLDVAGVVAAFRSTPR